VCGRCLASMGEVGTREVPSDIVELREKWFFWYKFWSGLHHIIGLGGMVGAILVTKVGPQFASVLSIGVAVCTATITFYQTGARARSFITGWRMLGRAIGDFKSDDAFTEKHLREVADRCEQQIIAPHDVR